MIRTIPADAVMRTLAEPTRRAVFERITASREITVGALAKGSGVTQGSISQHLASLKRAGLITGRATGRNLHYRAEPEGLALLGDWRSHHATLWRDRFADLRALLREVDP